LLRIGVVLYVYEPAFRVKTPFVCKVRFPPLATVYCEPFAETTKLVEPPFAFMETVPSVFAETTALWVEF
jgi:hypothetical protein